MELNRLTGIAIITTGEGERISFTFTTLDSEGNIISTNNKGSFIVMSDELQEHITAIKNYVNTNKLSKQRGV